MTTSVIDAGTVRLTYSTFEIQINRIFQIRFDSESPVELVLTQAILFGKSLTPDHWQPFSLIFHATGSSVLPQKIYPLEHEQLGVLELFLVPIGPDEKGMRYEAVFN